MFAESNNGHRRILAELSLPSEFRFPETGTVSAETRFAETRTRRLQVPASEHSTLDELDTSRNEPYRAIETVP